MTREGQIKLGKRMQDKARYLIDFEAGKSYAIWFVGAWLESSHLPGEGAKRVYLFLEDFLTDMPESFLEEQHDKEDDIDFPPSKFPDMSKTQIIEYFDIGEYSAALGINPHNPAGELSIIKYLYVLALYDESNDVPIFYVTAEKSFGDAVFLGTFDKNDNHLNYGMEQDWSDLDNFREAALKLIEDEYGDNEKIDNTTFESFENWYREFKKTAFQLNSQLALEEDGTSLLDFMDHEPLKRAYRDNVPPVIVATEFASQFDLTTFLNNHK